MATVGIDLGTYFSSVAAVTTADGKAEVIMNKDGTKATHSVVSFPSEKETLVGNIAFESCFLYPNETIKETKRLIGREKIAITVRGTSYSPQEISALILKSLCSDVERDLDQPVDQAVITVPAAFDSTQRAATIEAAKLAGIGKVLGLAEEPLAALVANGNLSSYVGKTVAVVDVGGGTADGCTVKVEKDENGKIVLNCICIVGDTHLGGVDFDRALYEYILKKDFAGVSLNAEEKIELEAKVEIAKRKLSEKLEVEFKVMVGGQRQKIHLTRKEFEEAVAGPLERVQKFLDEMKAYKIPDRVILCGGTTRIPKIEAMIRETFQGIPVGGENRELAVAEGAAILAQMYANGAEQAVFEKTDMDADKGAGNTGDDQTEDGQTDKGENGSGENGSDQDSTQMDLIPVKLNMVCSRSYGIGAFVHADKIMVCNVIFRNEAVPTVRETHSFVTSKDGMSECDFPIYESTGNERYVELSEAEKIGMCTLKIKGNLPKGTPLFVRVEAGIDGVLHFTGREESGNTEITAEFKTKTLLTEEELETAKQVVDDVYAKVV